MLVVLLGGKAFIYISCSLVCVDQEEIGDKTCEDVVDAAATTSPQAPMKSSSTSPSSSSSSGASSSSSSSSAASVSGTSVDPVSVVDA